MKRLFRAILALTGRRLVAKRWACPAAWLPVLAGAAAAPASVSHRPVQAARLDGAGPAVLAGPGNVARAGPGALGGSVVLGGSPRGTAGCQPEDRYPLRPGPVRHQLLRLVRLAMSWT